MFNYIFPIFCFGLVITGIVFLGIIEAAKHAKSLALVEKESKTHVPPTNGIASSNPSSARHTLHN